jgi:hypothetical protein
MDANGGLSSDAPDSGFTEALGPTGAGVGLR